MATKIAKFNFSKRQGLRSHLPPLIIHLEQLFNVEEKQLVIDNMMTILRKELTEMIPLPIKGERGDIGSKGEQGKSVIGVPGLQGLPGKKGITGRDAVVDVEAIMSRILPLIPKPIDGIDGVSPKIADILKEIEPEMEKIRQVVRRRQTPAKAGGGMGNPQHQVFTISSSTTTVTTDFPIAAGGTAIFNFVYENANLERTNHYTVGSDRRTITFGSDIQTQFENNTTASITYVRG